MEHLIAGVRDAIEKESWYAALALALTLPDTCAAIDKPGRNKNEERYTEWVANYVLKYFQSDQPGKFFIDKNDLYELRCSFLHEGALDVDPSKLPDNDPDIVCSMFSVLNRVKLIVADHDSLLSREIAFNPEADCYETACEIAVKDLCEWICKGVEEWLQEARKDEKKSARLARLGRIEIWRDNQLSVL